MTELLAIQEREKKLIEDNGRIAKEAHERDMALLHENKRIREGLDSVSMAVMIADNENKIVYTNAALIKLMRHVEKDLRENNPLFSAEKLIGTPTGQFMKTKSSDQVLGVITETFRAPLKVGSRRFQMTVNPVIDDGGTNIGSVMEWVDRTEEIAAEKEVARLVGEAISGHLSERAKVDVMPVGFHRDTGEGINKILDAVIGPLNVAARYVNDIAKGQIPAKITDNYNGDFNTLKDNLNTCINVINALVSDASMLSQAAVEGRLETRADASKHQGDFRKIVEGVNQTLDAVIGPLNVAAKYVDDIAKGQIPKKITDTYNGDFNTLKNNLNTCIDAVNALVLDANMLSKAAIDGKLSTRADSHKHQGDFQKIVG